MKLSIRSIQARLAALGFHPGPIDGLDGRRTQAALREAMERYAVDHVTGLFHPSGLHRIHWHWTAGAYGVIAVEHRAYNRLILQDGSAADGLFPIEAQAAYAPGKSASHTKNANSGAIGLAVDAMAGAKERPFDPGSAPLTWDQVHGLVRETADLCEQFWIPVSRASTLSHSEIQPTLGIRQRFKWDINWLPDMDRPGDPIEVGDRLRAMVTEELSEQGEVA
ncbi:peptidoglycan-binding domain-containing protein [Shimia sp.]|uniref:peptidoglycan-binding domain-containing protein n=1 Tax=Shimia sp. TaxID=1954381 RepID=UPI003BACDB1F